MGLKNLEFLILDGNPLKCDCKLYPIWKLSQERDFKMSEKDEQLPKCHGEEDKDWSVLENITCPRFSKKKAVSVISFTEVTEMVGLFITYLLTA